MVEALLLQIMAFHINYTHKPQFRMQEDMVVVDPIQPTNSEPQYEPINFGNWSDAASGCLHYYSHWYSPTISLSELHDDTASSDKSGSMETIYAKGTEPSRSTVSRFRSEHSFSYSDSHNSVKSNQALPHSWCCCTGCCCSLGCFRV